MKTALDKDGFRMENELTDKIRNVLQRLSIPVELKERNMQLPQNLPDGECTVSGDTLYLVLSQPDIVLSCPAECPGGSDVLMTVGAMAQAMMTAVESTETIQNAYIRILDGECNHAQLEALANEYRIPLHLTRAVIAFHISSGAQETAAALLKPLIPMESRDVLLDIDRYTAALIKDVSELYARGDLRQFTLALQETVQQETGIHITAGIGQSRQTLAGIHDSYQEAVRAIEIGRAFRHLGDDVYEFSRLLPERILAEIPPETVSTYCEHLTDKVDEEIFSPEMLFSVEAFFKQNLNLSQTARQLFIHRNTMVYRLEKIEKYTGLDLKNFSDAVTFKIMMDLKRSAGSELRTVGYENALGINRNKRLVKKHTNEYRKNKE